MPFPNSGRYNRGAPLYNYTNLIPRPAYSVAIKYACRPGNEAIYSEPPRIIVCIGNSCERNAERRCGNNDFVYTLQFYMCVQCSVEAL